MFEAAVTTLGGVVTGMIVGDSMGAVPIRDSVPATSNSARAKQTANGKIVTAGAAPSARDSLTLSAIIVVGAVATLLFGSRILKDARIG